ncbi:XrtA/PEP-CTERM system TPR-repeat protein PrsT [Thalassotalea piscium]|uniref:Putative PEP-CTERM system TPR-repeat lipoprotein n=1 Tax=Thalassotalea piscium TaxID=1230533 RepID=A0A7X0NEE3_9GAMM|nr:XrtA/PEP-CTERM system TPR-repeat protein PrsT [Thalassotalea piscium]MBB6541916.1 putative PEP-CTERM system TPR-repeat lipoprotein [Thalassotalea piscium]
MYLIKKGKKVIPLLVAAALAVGCSGQKTDEEYISLAKTSLAQGEVNAAIINLKNLLSANAQSAEGRFLLGKSYLTLGLWISAGKELELAYKSGYDPTAVIPLLAKAYYHLGDIAGLEELVAQLDLLPEETQTILKTFVAITYIKEQDLEQGIIYLYDVVEVDYDSKYTELSKAWKLGMDKEIAQAISVIDNILAEFPNFAEAIEYKAYLHFKAQDMALSAEYFGRYIAIHPQAHELRMMYAIALVYSEQYEKAEEQADMLLRPMPKNPKLNQIKAQTRFALNDYEQAKQFAEVAIRSDNKLVLSKVIAGISAYQLKQLEVAYSHLNSVSSQLSYQHPAKKLLNALKFQLGYEDDVLAEMLNMPSENVDVELLGASANELFKLGKVEAANSLLEKAAGTAPENADILYQQGLLKMFSDDDSAALFFEKALEKNPELETAMSMLLLERLKAGDYNKAFEIADNVAQKNPELALTFKGLIYARKGELDNAKAEFEKALVINKNNAGVYFKLGQVYELEKDTGSALIQYQKALNANLNYSLVVSSLLNIGRNNEYKENVQAYFEQLVDENSAEPIVYTYLAAFYIVRNELDVANSVLNNGLESVPNNFQLLMLKGKVLANSKHYDEAIANFNKALEQNAFSPTTLVAKANVLTLKGNYAEAIEAQKSAIELIPNSTEYKVGLADLYIKNRELPAASKILNNIQLAGKGNVFVERLLGKVAFLSNDFTKAHTILKNVAKTINTEDVIFELATSLQQLQRSADALNTIERYKSEVQAITSLDLLLKHAELLEKDKPEQALDIYTFILTKSDRHFAMLNNAAMVNLQLGNNKQAHELAKEAFGKAASNNAIVNTYGLTLLAVNDNKNAEKYLKQAFEANDKSANYKVHYAQALLANSKMSEAKTLMLDINRQELNAFTLPRYDALVKALGL